MSTVKEDHLKIDPVIPGQNWAVISFVSPEDMIVKRNLYSMNKWLHHDVNQTLKAQAIHAAKRATGDFMQRLQDVLNSLTDSHNEVDKLVFHKLKDIREQISLDEEEFAAECFHEYHLDTNEIQDKYQIYVSQHYEEIESEFSKMHNNATSVRGIKVRGVYNRKEEADERAKYLRDSVEPGIHAYVGQVGYWLPWDPNPDNVKESVYMNQQLNELMGKYHENVQAANKHFQERKDEMVEKANQERKDKLKQKLREKLMERKGK